jgi:hypothetical protein
MTRWLACLSICGCGDVWILMQYMAVVAVMDISFLYWQGSAADCWILKGDMFY